MTPGLMPITVTLATKTREELVRPGVALYGISVPDLPDHWTGTLHLRIGGLNAEPIRARRGFSFLRSKPFDSGVWYDVVQGASATDTGLILVSTEPTHVESPAPDAGTGASATEIQGNVAHDAADAGNPVGIGGHANAALPIAVGENDRVRASYTLEGQARVVAAGDVAHDAADGGAPVKVGGKGTAALPVAVGEGDRVQASYDLQGQARTIPNGSVAHDAADAGNPIKVGGTATAAKPAAVTEGDRVQASYDLTGQARVVVPDGIAGDTAHDAADAGNPVKVGGKATAAPPVAVRLPSPCGAKEPARSPKNSSPVSWWARAAAASTTIPSRCARDAD